MTQILAVRVKLSIYCDGRVHHKNLPLDMPVLEVAHALTENIIPHSQHHIGVPTLSRVNGTRLPSNTTLRAENIVDNDILCLSFERSSIPFVDIIEEISVPMGLLCEKTTPKFTVRDASNLVAWIFNTIILVAATVTHWWWYTSSYSTQAFVYSMFIPTVAAITALIAVLLKKYVNPGNLCYTPIPAAGLCAIKYEHRLVSWEQGILFCTITFSLLCLWLLVNRRNYTPIVTTLMLSGVALTVTVYEAVTHAHMRYMWLAVLTLTLLYPCVDYYSSVFAGLKIPRLITPDTRKLIPVSETRAHYSTNVDVITEENRTVFTITRRIQTINKITILTAGTLMLVSSVGLLWTTHKTVTNIAVCLISLWTVTRFQTTSTKYVSTATILFGSLTLTAQLLVIAVSQPGARETISILALVILFCAVLSVGFAGWAVGRDIPRVHSVLNFTHYTIILATIPLLLFSVNAYSVVRGI